MGFTLSDESLPPVPFCGYAFVRGGCELALAECLCARAGFSRAVRGGVTAAISAIIVNNRAKCTTTAALRVEGMS